MFFPIGDVPNPRGFRPWVNWLLIATNVAVYLLFTLPLSMTPPSPRDPELPRYVEMLRHTLPPGMSVHTAMQGLSAYDLFVFAHGYKPAMPELSDLFSAMFLHSGLGHLLGNMLFLWIYGDNVEHRLGRLGYLVAWLGTGVVSTLAFSLLSLHSMAPLIGASGAISGVLGLYFVFFPRNQVKVFVFLFPFVMNTFYLSARLVLGIFVVIDNLLPLVLGGGGGVAYGAHLGGFLAGLALAVGIDRLGVGLRPAPRRRAVQEEHPLPGDDARAQYLALVRALQQRPPEREEARLRLALAVLLLRQGQPSSAYAHLIRVLDLDADPETRAAAQRILDGQGVGPAAWSSR